MLQLTHNTPDMTQDNTSDVSAIAGFVNRQALTLAVVGATYHNAATTDMLHSDDKINPAITSNAVAAYTYTYLSQIHDTHKDLQQFAESIYEGIQGIIAEDNYTLIPYALDYRPTTHTFTDVTLYDGEMFKAEDEVLYFFARNYKQPVKQQKERAQNKLIQFFTALTG